MSSKRPKITSRTNIGWYYSHVPKKCPRVVEQPDVIATPGRLDGEVSLHKIQWGLGRFGVEYGTQLYRKLDGRWVQLTMGEAVDLAEKRWLSLLS